jgi:hypothetical protein
MMFVAPVSAQDTSPVDSVKQEDAGKVDSSDVTIESEFFLNDPLMIDEEVDEESHDQIFPLWKSIAKGKALPKPWSVGAFQYGSITDYTIGESKIGFGELPDIQLKVDSTAVDLQIGTVGIKGALWLLPFLNVYVNMAYTSVNFDIYLENIPTSVEPPNPPQQPLPKITVGNVLLNLELSGPTTGTGVTFAFGWKQIFTTVTFSYSYSSLSASNFEAFGDQIFKTFMFLPKIGYSFEGTSVWFGARWMDDEANYKGSLQDGAFRFDVKIHQNKWSPEFGINTIMGENWELTLQAGYEPRLFSYFSVGYRI